jgi:hypothetical protein
MQSQIAFPVIRYVKLDVPKPLWLMSRTKVVPSSAQLEKRSFAAVDAAESELEPLPQADNTNERQSNIRILDMLTPYSLTRLTIIS